MMNRRSDKDALSRPLLLASVVLGLAGTGHGLATPAHAQDPAEYPEHIRLEIETQNLERRKRIEDLRLELAAIKNSEIANRSAKLQEILGLMRTEKEIRDMLYESPDLYPLYRASVGDDPGQARPTDILPDPTDASPIFCDCLQSASVRWLGRGEQAGEAVVYLHEELFDVSVGERIGRSWCYLQKTTATHALLSCRDPVENKELTERAALQLLPE